MSEKALFAGGCFWGIQDVFNTIPGVIETTVGYCGGWTPEPTYEQVCSDTTGHAETVLVVFDPKKVSYAELVNVFLNSHDPTTLNRQGPDIGSQYRSAIFYLNDAQQKTALSAIRTYNNRNGVSAVTEVTSAKPFYPAEEYHQNYHQKHKTNCFINRIFQ